MSGRDSYLTAYTEVQKFNIDNGSHWLYLIMQFRKDEVQMEDDIPYKYGFFHLIFSLGAMYFAMLFISWNLDNSTRK